MSDETENSKTRQEMEEIQKELQEALADLMKQVGDKLNDSEKSEIEQEFEEVNQLLDRLKTGLVHVSLFGKTSSGKSAITNALIGSDMAKVGIEHDLSRDVVHYRRSPWMIADMPGIMGKSELEKIAIGEAKLSHGIIFVIDGEPYQDEIEMFENLHQELPTLPKIVFVNKWDTALMKPKADREKIQELIYSKMRKFVTYDEDIVYGSAQLYNPSTDGYERQELPGLLDRMYEGAGTLGDVMNVLDPARRSADLGSKIRDKILGVRMKLARKVISAFGTAEVITMFVPFASLVITPGLLAGMVYALMRILGVEKDMEEAKTITKDLLVVCAQEMLVDFAGSTVVEVGAWVGAIIFFPLAPIIGLGAGGAVGYYKYNRTVIFGEVVIEYLKNDCSWGGEDRHVVIIKCRDRANEHYMKLKRSMNS